MKTLIKIFLILFPFVGFSQLGTGLFGKVGINAGTTAPTEILKVVGTANITGALTLGSIANVETQINLKAPISSPTFTGTVTMPSTNINTRRVANYTDFQAIITANNFIGLVYVDTDSTNGNLPSTYIVKNNTFQWILSL